MVVATAAPITPSSGKGPDAEDEQRVQHDVDAVGDARGPQGHARISRTTEHRVDREEQQDRSGCSPSIKRA